MNPAKNTCMVYGLEMARVLREELQDAFRARMTSKTHTALNSIDAWPVVEEKMSGSTYVGVDYSAGGGEAFYLVFHEYGTGMHIENMAQAKAGYYDKEGNLVSFNQDRLDYPAGSGYLILKRSGPGKGMIKSKGVTAKHFIEKGYENAQARIEELQLALDMELMLASSMDSMLNQLQL
jgi:hypothetical protein